MSSFPMTSPRRVENRDNLIRAAAAKLNPEHLKGKPKHPSTRAKSTIDAVRLKLPWLTIYPVTTRYAGAWSEERRHTVYRLYLNAPARKIVFNGSRKETVLSAVFKQDENLLAIVTTPGVGLSLLFRSYEGGYASNPDVSNPIVRNGYLLDGEPTYFPLQLIPHGFVADLGEPHTKADAVAVEEDLTR
jgi:hypothetical protein